MCTGGTVVDQTLYSCVWKESDTRVATAAVKRTKVVTEASISVLILPSFYALCSESNNLKRSLSFAQIVDDGPLFYKDYTMASVASQESRHYIALECVAAVFHLSISLSSTHLLFYLCLFLCIYSLSLLMARAPRLGDSAFPTNANEQTEKNTPQSSPLLTSSCFSLAL